MVALPPRYVIKWMPKLVSRFAISFTIARPVPQHAVTHYATTSSGEQSGHLMRIIPCSQRGSGRRPRRGFTGTAVSNGSGSVVSPSMASSTFIARTIPTSPRALAFARASRNMADLPFRVGA